ncbi:Na+/H+ antiporter subunit E [Hydrogenophaga sp. SL48]|uniref:Na+/H+ antiporter subunit E n=1 Tax=Hydrogenophaga sp. SL48 TaxID=2806347 RepID=UPI001F35F6C5|nr:Na+/H+ antiporter subunit E [Hydrogenophaga sp. SL48]UJW83177.1 monovalent cation/H+ antiporter subunit E [Hydrogenophaga sp. SL48]
MTSDASRTAPRSKRYPARGWFAHPVLSVLLGLSWLALSHSLEPVHLLSALLIGLVVPRLLSPFLTQASAVHWPTALRLMAVVLWDIVVSNVVVARLVLGPLDRMQPGWIPVPLASDHHRVNALFASIITTTPGTVSAVIDEEKRVILVHALVCEDAAAMATEMKNRYEAPLLRVFHLDPGSLT